MFRFSFLLIGLLIISGCTTSRVQNYERASALNTELGLAYLIKGSYEQALKKLKKAIKQNPDNAKPYSYIAELYRRLNENELAEDYFNQALDVDPNDASINNNYGAYLCANKEYDKAFKFFKIALKNPVYSGRGEVFENIGLCSESQGNIKIARDNYVKAISIDPNLSKSLLAVALIDFDAQKVDSAHKYIRYYNKVAKATPQSLWLEILIAKKNNDTKTIKSLSWSLNAKFPKSKEAKLLKRLIDSGEI